MPVQELRRLVIKELVDNALDAGGDCRLSMVVGDGTYIIEDDGPGLPGTPEDVASLFSIRRPMTSTKLLYRPVRGALGNGLRVVAAAVLVSNGRLTIETNGRRLELAPQDDGGTRIVSSVPLGRDPGGTRIEIALGNSIPPDPGGNPLAWGAMAIDMASVAGEQYQGKTSPWWYDADKFWELCQSAGEMSVRELVECFEGCSGAKAGKIAAGFKGRLASTVTRDESAGLLSAARATSKPVAAHRLGSVGPECPLLGPCGYKKADATLKMKSGRGGVAAEVPVLIEAWAAPATGKKDTITIFVNRTPVAAEYNIHRGQDKKTDAAIFGCGLHHALTLGVAPRRIVLNITTPRLPIISDGKAPDLSPLNYAILSTIEAAARRSRKHQPAKGERKSIKKIIMEHVQAGLAKASGGVDLAVYQRQLFYAIRDMGEADLAGRTLSDNYFGQVITDYENEHGQIRLLHRDNRGVIYHPHVRELIGVGTLSVRGYECPKFTFNKVLYIEKQGPFPVLQSAGWPERNDIALLTSKGYASRACRDLIDAMGDGDEEITFYCIHDADAYGTRIYHALQEATAARPGRKVKIINLGLDPWEAVEMGLKVEKVDGKHKQKRPCGDYVPAEWQKWLQSYRVELNSMTTRQLIDWLDRKLASAGAPGKIIPSPLVVQKHVEETARRLLVEKHTAEILRSAGLDRKVERDLRKLKPTIIKAAVEGDINAEVEAVLEETPEAPWKSPADSFAERLVTKHLTASARKTGCGK